MALGAPGLARDDERRFALRILDTVLGGTSSSRLFQEVREQRGLAYSVYSFTGSYAGTGQIGLYLGTRPDNVQTAMKVVGTELDKLLADGITAEELDRSKENVKGRVVLALESTTARMNRLGSSVLADMPVLTVDEVVERIDAVTLDDVAALARELYAPERLSAAGIGGDESVFRGALEAGVPDAGGGGVSQALRVGVAGAAGKVGRAICDGVEAADDLVLGGRADPGARHAAGGDPARLRCGRRLHAPRHGAGERDRLRRGRRARGDRDDGLRSGAAGASAAAPATRSWPRTSRSARS